jgi:ferrous iron transport protein A
MVTTLADVRSNDRFEVVDVPDEDTRAQLLRLGFLDGEVECRQRVRNGPVILRRNGTELALGRALATEIEVQP